MNRKIIVILLVLGLILGFTSVSMAIHSNTTENSVNNSSNSYNGTIYVSTTGNDSNDGFTPETSKKSIKKAVDIAPVNATILVAPGTYIEGPIHIKKSLQLISENGSETTIIKSNRSFYVMAGTVLAKGFTIMPIKKNPGFGEVVDCHRTRLILENCKILNFCPKNDAFAEAYRGHIIYINCTLVKHSQMGAYEKLYGKVE